MFRIVHVTDDLCKLKIDDPSTVSVVGNQDIISPDITMDNAEGMNGIKRL